MPKIDWSFSRLRGSIGAGLRSSLHQPIVNRVNSNACAGLSRLQHSSMDDQPDGLCGSMRTANSRADRAAAQSASLQHSKRLLHVFIATGNCATHEAHRDGQAVHRCICRRILRLDF